MTGTITRDFALELEIEGQDPLRIEFTIQWPAGRTYTSAMGVKAAIESGHFNKLVREMLEVGFSAEAAEHDAGSMFPFLRKGQ